MGPKRVLIPPPEGGIRIQSSLGLAWAAFVVVGLLLMGVFGDMAYGVTVAGIALAVCLLGLISRRVRAAFPWMRWRVDGRDLAAVAAAYLVVVGLFRLAFSGFTTENTLGMFLSFGSALTLGVAGPVIYTAWFRRRRLASLGLGLRGAPIGLGFVVALFGGGMAALVIAALIARRLYRRFPKGFEEFRELPGSTTSTAE